MKIKFDNDQIKTMSLFGAITKSNLKDYFVDENTALAYFIVDKGELRKAVGKQGSNVKLLEKKLNRKIKIVEFDSDILQFVRNLVFPIKLKDIEMENDVITLETEDRKSRGIIIGRSAQNLRNLEKIAKRYHEISEIKVK